MEEFIDILTSEGATTGQSCSKFEIHSKGHYHNTAHIWFYTPNGEILLAQRSARKLIYPLLWDVSVAGHIDTGETIEQGALREIKEEIGLTVQEKELQKIGVFECFHTYDSGFIDNEFHHTFIVELKSQLTELIPQKGEVEALKLVTTNEFSEILETIGSDKHLVASNINYYQFVWECILKKAT